MGCRQPKPAKDPAGRFYFQWGNSKVGTGNSSEARTAAVRANSREGSGLGGKLEQGQKAPDSVGCGEGREFGCELSGKPLADLELETGRHA